MNKRRPLCSGWQLLAAMGSSTSCAPEEVQKGCAQAMMCQDDILDRRYLNVQLLAGARDGEAAVVMEALKAGANTETRHPMRILAGSASNTASANAVLDKASRNLGPTPLMLAAKSGSVACVRTLLAYRARIQAKDEDGMRPLHFAALSGELQVLKVLLDAKADPGDRDNDDRHLLDHLPLEVLKDRCEMRQWEALVGGPAVPSQATREPGGLRQGLDAGCGAREARACGRGTISKPAKCPLASGGLDPETPLNQDVDNDLHGSSSSEVEDETEESTSFLGQPAVASEKGKGSEKLQGL